MRVARGHHERLGRGGGRLGEGDLTAALGGDEHTGGEDVETVGVQAGDQTVPVDGRGLDLGNPQFLEDGLGDGGRLPRGVTGVVDETERDLVGQTDRDEALLTQSLQRRLPVLVRSAVAVDPGARRETGHGEPDTTQAEGVSAAPGSPPTRWSLFLHDCSSDTRESGAFARRRGGEGSATFE